MGRNQLVGAIAMASIAASLGCGVEKTSNGNGNGAPGDLGTVQVALTASTPGGTVYRVEGATFEIYNFAGACPGFPCATVPGDDPTLTVELAPSVFPGDYTISLDPGWTVSRVAADGTETPVPAMLLTNGTAFTIKPGRTTPVVFQFQIGEEIATTGDGSVSVTPQFLETLIDDFEDGDDQLAPFGGRNGVWTAFNDGSGVETPPAGPVLPEVLDTTANEELHLTGTGFGAAGRLLPDGTYSYGAGVYANFVVDATTGLPQPYNVSAYSGIGFTLVMRTPPTVPFVVAFFLQTQATLPIAAGGTCVAGCNDGFGIDLPFFPDRSGTSTFQGVIPWASLLQSGFGVPVPFDLTTVMSIDWLVSFPDQGQAITSDVFDFRLDDVYFAPGGLPVPSADGGAAPPPSDAGDDVGPPPAFDGGAPDVGSFDGGDFDGGPPPPPPGKPVPFGPVTAKAPPG
jgi:hypothetical protein